MKLVWMDQAWEDYLHWQSLEPATMQKLNALLKEIRRDPFRGLGKPEPLRNELRGWWSRRINGEHRLVYRIVGSDEEKAVEILQCRWHYGR